MRSPRKASATCRGRTLTSPRGSSRAGQPGAPLLLVNPSGAGTATIGPEEGEDPWRLRIGRNGIADLGNDPALGSQLQRGAHITVLSPSGRKVVETEWTSEDDPYVLDSL